MFEEFNITGKMPDTAKIEKHPKVRKADLSDPINPIGLVKVEL